MEIAEFTGYENGSYLFILNESEEFEFEEVSKQVLNEFNLKNNGSLVGKYFELTFSEHYEDDEDLIVYKIESLKLL